MAPELDDAQLGRAVRAVTHTGASGPADLHFSFVEQLLNSTGNDWDRRCHRLTVLAEYAPRVARSWRLRSPEHPDALLLHAWSIGAEGRDPSSRAAVEAAVDDCRIAGRIRPADPTPWVVTLRLLRVLGCPVRDLMPVWKEISRREFWHREAYRQILGYLSPEEHGSQAALVGFLDDVRAIMPEQSPVVGLPLEAAIRQYHRDLTSGGTRALGVGRYWDQPHISSLLDHAVQRWPVPAFLRHAARCADLNNLAYALARARRSAEARSVLGVTDGVVTPWPWNHDGDPLDRYTYWSDRVGRADRN